MIDLKSLIEDLDRLSLRVEKLTGASKFAPAVIEYISKMNSSLQAISHPPIPTNYAKFLIKHDRSIRFYIARGVYYDSVPGPESDAFIEMVNEFYFDHTELAKLNCEEGTTLSDRLLENDEATS